MRLLKATVENFGSYKHLSFDYTEAGLALVYGPTGSGKSTLADIAPWCLFGITAKDGNVDEIRSWTAEEGVPTTGTLSLTTHAGPLTVSRIRGTQKQNDLYWTEGESDELKRGKDLADTQRLLEERLGVTSELYLTGAYFQEFSKTGLFFSSKAKDRRAVFEQIADIRFPNRLASSSSEARKETKKSLSEVSAKIQRLEGRLGQLKQILKETQISATDWDKESQSEAKAKELLTLEKQWAALDLSEPPPYEALAAETRQLIKKAKAERCTSCGAPKAHKDVEEFTALLNRLLKEEQDHKHRCREAELIKKRIADLRIDSGITNPFTGSISHGITQIVVVTDELNVETAIKDTLIYKANALLTLYDLASTLRGVLLTNVVSEIQYSTNDYLTRFFDAPLQVSFTLEDDKLEVDIQKSGYPCVYRQLSKGQRGLLKLCFAASVMKAASNASGVHFDDLFLDEALDGLDSELKVKAFTLLQDLASGRSSVLVIDHSTELRECFDQHYEVKLIADTSELSFGS